MQSPEAGRACVCKEPSSGLVGREGESERAGVLTTLYVPAAGAPQGSEQENSNDSPFKFPLFARRLERAAVRIPSTTLYPQMHRRG